MRYQNPGACQEGKQFQGQVVFIYCGVGALLIPRITATCLIVSFSLRSSMEHPVASSMRTACTVVKRFSLIKTEGLFIGTARCVTLHVLVRRAKSSSVTTRMDAKLEFTAASDEGFVSFSLMFL